MQKALYHKPPRGAIPDWSHPLAEGLEACWLFNEGQEDEIYDITGRGNHGALTNMDPATDWTASSLGWVLDFDGANDHIVQPVKMVGAGTVAFWLNPTHAAGTSQRCFFGSADMAVPPNESFYMINWNNGNSYWGWYQAVLWRVTTAAAFPPGWFHVALRWDIADGNIILYWNGVEIGRVGGVNAVYDMQHLPYIGANNFIGAYDHPFDGQLTDFRIYSRALSPAEVIELYQQPFGHIRTRDMRLRPYYHMPHHYEHSEGGDVSVAGGQTVAADYDESVGGDVSVVGGQVVAGKYDILAGGGTPVTGATLQNIIHRGHSQSTVNWDWVRAQRMPFEENELMIGTVSLALRLYEFTIGDWIEFEWDHSDQVVDGNPMLIGRFEGADSLWANALLGFIIEPITDGKDGGQCRIRITYRGTEDIVYDESALPDAYGPLYMSSNDYFEEDAVTPGSGILYITRQGQLASDAYP